MSAPKIRLALGFAVMAICHTPAQSPPPSAGGNGPRDDHTGLLMGTVIDARNKDAMPGAIVSIGHDRVISDRLGRFVFLDLPKGDYGISASKRGFLDGAYGRRRPEGPAQSIALEEDERVGDLKIPMWKSASISGVVTDDTGGALVDVPVDVLARVLVGGKWTLRPVGRTRTDDRGTYRLGGLAGRQYVVAAPTVSILPPQASESLAYPLTYYPGAPSITQAAAVALKAGEDRLGVDLQREITKAARVRGIVVDPTGLPVSVPLALTARIGDAAASGGLDTDQTMSDKGGRFAFPGVTAGTYDVVVAHQPDAEPGMPPERLMWAKVPVTVQASDVESPVQLKYGARVSGRMIFEGRRLLSDEMRNIRGYVESADGGTVGASRMAPIDVDASGRFTSPDLVPGRYVFRIPDPPRGWAVKNVNVSGRDYTRAAIDVTSDINVSIVLTERAPEVSGTVRGTAGATPDEFVVIVFPTDARAWQDFGSAPPFLRTIRPGRTGRYKFQDLPPGEYFIAAVIDDPSVELLEVPTLTAISRLASRVVLAEGSKRSIELTPQVIVR